MRVGDFAVVGLHPREPSDGEKKALSFLLEAAYREAIEKRRLVAMYADDQHKRSTSTTAS
jgi:hypothetical protein